MIFPNFVLQTNEDKKSQMDKSFTQTAILLTTVCFMEYSVWKKIKIVSVLLDDKPIHI